MTLELLQFIRDNNKHLQGHQYQIIQVIDLINKKYRTIDLINTKYRIID